MIRLLVRYLTNVSKITVHQWNCFWFATRPTFDIGITRVAIGFLAAIYAAGWCFDLYGWTQPDGKLNDSVTRFLIGDQIEGTGSIGRVSLLYQLESKWMVQSYLIVTSLFSIALALGIGGRAIAVVTWILTLGIVHRVPMLQGSGDLLFVGIMGYLAIDPGKTKR